MHGKPSKQLVWWTIGFFVVIAVLAGIALVDLLVPSTSRQLGNWRFARSFGFNGDTACCWLYALHVWLIILAVLWRAEIWPRRPSACRHCDYDRTGIAADSVCPECGKAP